MLKLSQLQSNANKNLNFSLNLRKQYCIREISQNSSKDTFKVTLILNLKNQQL
jgi:hypothetical protein